MEWNEFRNYTIAPSRKTSIAQLENWNKMQRYANAWYRKLMKRCMQIAAELIQKNTAFASLFFQCKMSLVKCALSVFVLRAMCIVHIIFSVHMWNMRAMNRSILKMQLNELKRKMHLYIMLCDAKLRWCMVKQNNTKPQRSNISKFPKPKIYIKVIYVRIVAPLPRFRAMQHFCSSVAGSFGSYSCFRFGLIFHILRCGSCRLMVLFSSLRAIARACNAMRGNCDDFIFNEENKTLALFCLFVCLRKNLCRSFCLSFTRLIVLLAMWFCYGWNFRFCTKHTCAPFNAPIFALRCIFTVFMCTLFGWSGRRNDVCLCISLCDNFQV